MTSEMRSRIIGTGKYQAQRILSNADLEKLVDTSDEWIRERTGIRERRLATEDVASSDMAAHALQEALQMAGKQPNDLDMIICGTVTPDRMLPATAAYVQKKIGASNHCASFDLSAACAGFIYGLSAADAYIKSGKAKTVAVIGTELLSRFMDWGDRNTCILFGDGAGAVVLTADTADRGILSTHQYTNAELTELLKIPAGGSLQPASTETVAANQHCIQMEGREVFRYAVRYLSSAAMTAVETNGKTPDDVNLVVAHQANLRILEGVSQRGKIPMERFVLNLEYYGNTSSASIPIALDEANRAGRIREDDILLMLALGGGISWGSALIKW